MHIYMHLCMNGVCVGVWKVKMNRVSLKNWQRGLEEYLSLIFNLEKKCCGKRKNLSLWKAIARALVGLILMKFVLQACRQIQTSQITVEDGCSKETALFSGWSHFGDNECNVPEYAKSLFSMLYNWKTIWKHLSPYINALKLS